MAITVNISTIVLIFLCLFLIYAVVKFNHFIFKFLLSILLIILIITIGPSILEFLSNV